MSLTETSTTRLEVVFVASMGSKSGVGRSWTYSDAQQKAETFLCGLAQQPSQAVEGRTKEGRSQASLAVVAPVLFHTSSSDHSRLINLLEFLDSMIPDELRIAFIFQLLQDLVLRRHF